MTDSFVVEVPARLTAFAGRPRVGIVLGSGFGGVTGAVEHAVAVPFREIEGFPDPGTQVAGHAGVLVFGTLSGVPVAVFSGRVHGYQGASARDAAYTARLASALGCQVLIVTNASGSVAPELYPGEVVLIEDQINLTGQSPLTGWPGPADGVPFVPMRDAYDPMLGALARNVAAEQGVRLVGGVYAGVTGPAFETPAEARMLRTVGADVVGMSTVHEVVAARALDMRVLGFSLVTNSAAGVGLSHDEVLEAGHQAESSLTALLVGILSEL